MKKLNEHGIIVDNNKKQKMQTQNKQKSVIKASGAIHISNSINLMQRQAWNILLANCYDDLPDKESHQISISELCLLLEIKTRNIEHIKKTLMGLMGCVVEWNIIGKHKEAEWGAVCLLSRVKIKNGICEYAFDKEMGKKLYSPKMYAKINIHIQNKFSSKDALALYEVLNDYCDKKRGRGETPFLAVAQFKSLMGLSKDQYPTFKSMNRDMIRPAIQEINQKSDLFSNVKHKKMGRKITHLKFHVKQGSSKQTGVKYQLKSPENYSTEMFREMVEKARMDKEKPELV